MKAVFFSLMVTIFGNQAAADAGRTLEKYFVEATEAAEMSDIDFKNLSTDHPQQCAFAAIGEATPRRASLSRFEVKWQGEDFGPLFNEPPNSSKEMIDLNFLGVPDLSEQDMQALSSGTVQRTSEFLIIDYPDSRYGRMTVYMRRHEKNLAFRFTINSGSMYFGYCYRR
jgi:hypothetical protein